MTCRTLSIVGGTATSTGIQNTYPIYALPELASNHLIDGSDQITELGVAESVSNDYTGIMFVVQNQ